MQRDYFPYMVQAETLVIDAIEPHAVSGNKLKRRTVAVPANMAADLSGQTGYSDLSLASDANVLKRDPAIQIFFDHSLLH